MREVSFIRGITIMAGILNIVAGCLAGMGIEFSNWYIAFTFLVLGIYQLFDRIKED